MSGPVLVALVIALFGGAAVGAIALSVGWTKYLLGDRRRTRAFLRGVGLTYFQSAKVRHVECPACREWHDRDQVLERFRWLERGGDP